MARPATKQDLLLTAQNQFDKLWEIIEGMTEEEKTAGFVFEDRDRNLRDVLIHLYEWHQLLLNWVAANSKGESKPFLPKPYNWRTYPKMNVEFWEKHQKTSYQQAAEILHQSHKAVMALMRQFSNEELFGKNQFLWTGTTTLGSYCVSATSSHYDWAMKKNKAAY